MKRSLITFITTITVLICLMTVAQPVLAGLWYAGNYQTSAYGVRAFISTPGSAPAVYGAGTSHWVSTPLQYPGWVQTGWQHTSQLVVAKPYVEVVVSGQPWYREYYGTQAWGISKQYKLDYASGWWYVYIDGSLKFFTSQTAGAPIYVYAQSEIQNDSRCVVDTWFSTVQWKNSLGNWNYFNQNHLAANPPYHASGSYYVFHTWGP